MKLKYIAADADTLFPLGSITKLFTATAVMQLLTHHPGLPSNILSGFQTEIFGLNTYRKVPGYQKGIKKENKQTYIRYGTSQQEQSSAAPGTWNDLCK